MIDFVTNIDGGARAENTNNLTGQGVEFQTHWQPTGNFKLSANYASQSTQDGIEGQQVEYVPQKQFYFDAQWRINSKWKLSTQLNWVMDRARATNDLRKPIDDYKRINLTLRRSNLGFSSKDYNWEFAIALKNLFDEDIYEPSNGKIPSDYLMHGRRIYAELSYKL
jgi:outer membrane receptor protein involved in Fe transport